MPFDGVIEPLGAQHEKRKFSCGTAALDEYLQRFASQHEKSRLSRTYVAADGTTVAGYYSLAMAAIVRDVVPLHWQSRFPRFPLPVARLARLAVARSYQGRGIGGMLLLDALYRSLHLSAGIGMVAVVVDAKDESAARFYRYFDFEAFPESPLTLWLPIAALERLFPPEKQS
jgi:GNAT superfamily N-acetyltransferase